jgi:site-specific DNA recombinase
VRFAFYGRVSTEDQQDPKSSKDWQLSRARSLIEPAGGVIVEEFFDIGQSRSLPWKRRPEALRLLEAFKDPARGFEAVVIGEPQRAFYGGQFGLTFPVMTHYGVALWVPEVGGAVDPGSDAHDLVMALYGGMSKGERNRIKLRVRTAMTAQASQGRFLGGRPPYGYALADDGPHPNPGKAAVGQRAHRLEVDQATAPIVRRIFEEYLAGAGLYAIAEGLTRDGVPCPSAADPARNRHRSGIAWSKSAVRAILRNPRYTGRQVWNRQRRDEQLLDVEDVAAGHETKMRWNDRGDWVWSSELAHEAIIDPETFTRAQHQADAGAHRPAERKPRSTPRPYLLRGLVYCGLCGRKMQGNWNNGRAHYRCRLATEYALANRIDHPKAVYVREDAVLPLVDERIAELFAPANLDDTVSLLMGAQAASDGDEARADAARRKLEDCDHRLAKYRAALEAGADPVVVSGWLQEVQGERLTAERDLAACAPTDELDRAQVAAMLAEVGDVGAVLAEADPTLRAQVYSGLLGLRLTYMPDDRTMAYELAPCAYERVGGASAPIGTRPVLRGVLALG